MVQQLTSSMPSYKRRVVEVLRSIKGLRVNVTPLDPLVGKVLTAAGINPDDSDRYACIPRSLEEQLMPFQRAGVKFALQHGGRALIGDEMVRPGAKPAAASSGQHN